jgi:hypothetical protein
MWVSIEEMGKMKKWLCFYIKHTIKNAEPFYKETVWSLGLNKNYTVMS